MIHKLFAVYDSTAKVYTPPFTARNDGDAMRMFTTAVNSANHQFNVHAKDYFLHSIGEWDDTLGKITPARPELVTSAVACLIPTGPTRNQLDLIDNMDTGSTSAN